MSDYQIRVSKGAYVPTDEEREACDMVRKMIALCQEHVQLLCNMCMHITHKKGNGMSDYPRRGEMSDDGKLYTHTDGSVHESEIGVDNGCHVCSVAKTKHRCIATCTCSSHFRIVEGAYVPTDEECEACDMARKMIALCSDMADCDYCLNFEKKSCPARAYLAAHGCADAWEAKT